MPQSLLMRLLRLAVATLIGLAMAIPIYVYTDSLPTPVRALRYTVFFDPLLWLTEPVVRDAVHDDPALYHLLLERTKAAYLKDGWPGATDALHAVMSEYVLVYADDAHVLRLARAYYVAEAKLAMDPERCKRYGLTSYNEADWEPAKDEIRLAHEAFDSAVADGARGWHEGVRKPKPTDDAVETVWLSSLHGPEQLSRDEIAALSAGKNAAAPIWCAADLRQERNLLARPEAEAAELYRTLYFYNAREGGRTFLPTLPANPTLPTNPTVPTSPTLPKKEPVKLPVIQRH
jgi:hypothetical protein